MIGWTGRHFYILIMNKNERRDSVVGHLPQLNILFNGLSAAAKLRPTDRVTRKLAAELTDRVLCGLRVVCGQKPKQHQLDNGIAASGEKKKGEEGESELITIGNTIDGSGSSSSCCDEGEYFDSIHLILLRQAEKMKIVDF